MPQIEIFQCPSCGANLRYDGGPETTVTCQFCGNTAIVPAELRPSAPSPAAPPIIPIAPSMPGDQTDIVALLQQLAGHAASTDPDRAARVAALLTALEQMQTPAASSAGDAHLVGMRAVEQLARTGRMMDAMRVYQLLTRTDPASARAAVEAMAGGVRPVYTPPVPPAMPPLYAAPAPAARRAGRLAGCSGSGCLLLVVAGFIAFFVAVGYLPLRLSGSYQQAVDAVRSDPAAIAALGYPIEVNWWVPASGQIKCSGVGCSAYYDISIHGSRGSGSIRVRSSSTGWTFFSEGTWTLRYDLHLDNGSTIAWKPSPPPAPTLSSQQVQATQMVEERNKQATAEMASARATATDVAQRQAADDATATVVAQAAATDDAQAAIQADMATQESWPVLYSDSFANNRLGWPTGSASKQGLVITNTLSQKSFLWQVVPGHGGFGHAFPLNCPVLTDFTASVKVTFTKVDENGQTHFGLVFRESGDQYGFFGLNGGGGYWIRQGTSSMYDSLQSSSVAINSGPGQSNKLTVRVLGTDVIFAINDQVVRLLDDQLPGGRVGVGAEWEQKGSQLVTAQFNDFEVRAPK